MRNRYAGTCYWCGEVVEPGKGYFERRRGPVKWATIHDACMQKQRRAKALAKAEGITLDEATTRIHDRRSR